MKLQCYLCFDLEIELFLFLFSDPDPVRILLLFPFPLLCPKAVITLVARYLRWRVRVELQLQPFDDDDSCESLRLV